MSRAIPNGARPRTYPYGGSANKSGPEDLRIPTLGSHAVTTHLQEKLVV